MFKQIAGELRKHAPFTAVGAATGMIIMVLLVVSGTSARVSNAVFYTLHPLHVVLSALVTTSMYRLHGRGRLWAAVLVGYTGSVGVATLSDAVMPFLGGCLLNVPMEFHAPFIEATKMPFIGVEKWIVVNSAAGIGIVVGCWKPVTKLPHAGHVLLSTWASLFNFSAFGAANWMPLLPFLYVFLFLAVWLPCCVSDVVYPLLWTKEDDRANGIQKPRAAATGRGTSGGSRLD